MKKKYKRQIKNIMEHFNFERVSQIMCQTDWRWGRDVPEVDDLKKTAKHMLRTVARDNVYYSSTGGFSAVNNEGKLDLFFGEDSLLITDKEYK
jgi:hypothetical protein